MSFREICCELVHRANKFKNCYAKTGARMPPHKLHKSVVTAANSKGSVGAPATEFRFAQPAEYQKQVDSYFKAIAAGKKQ